MSSASRSSTLRAVLDTNVIVSALIAGRGVPAEVYRSAQRGAFRFVSSVPLFDELERVLTVKLGMPSVRAARLRERVARSAELVPLRTPVSVFPVRTWR